MNVELAQELLNELGSSLEHIETRHAALLQFLKDKGVVAEADFAPYLEQAARTSSVRWRAARVRLEHLFSAETLKEERAAEKERQSTGGEQGSDQSHEEGAKAENEKNSSTPAPQGEEAETITASASTQSDTEKDKSKG
jgi:uncharacterized protein YdaU (DUF1376 family)